MKTIALLFLLSLPLQAKPITFTVDASGAAMPQADHDWLLNSYLPARWEAERQIITWVNGQPAIAGDELTVNVHLHPTLFPGFEGAGIVGGQMLHDDFHLTYEVHVAWDYEQRAGVTLSHEFGHILQLLSGCAGWLDIGHGTPADPILQKLLAIGEQVYMAGHVYDPFKAGVY